MREDWLERGGKWSKAKLRQTKKKQVAKNKRAQAQTKTEESLEELFSISI